MGQPVTIALNIDPAGFTKGIDRAKGDVSGFSRGLDSVKGSVTSFFASLGGGPQGFGRLGGSITSASRGLLASPTAGVAGRGLGLAGLAGGGLLAGVGAMGAI